MSRLPPFAAAAAALMIAAFPACAAPSPAAAGPTDWAAAQRTAEALRDKALRGSEAYTLLEALTTEIGPRPAGSPAERRAAAWAVERLKALGFENVHTESFPVAYWQRGEERAEVLSPYPQRLVVAALGGSVPTPPQGVEGEIVVFHAYDDMLAAPVGSLAGKIAVVTQPMAGLQDGSGYGVAYRIRGQGAAEAAKRGAIAYLIRSLASDERRLPHTGTMRYMPEFAGGGASGGRIPAAALSVPDAEQLDRMVARGKPVRVRLMLQNTTLQNAETQTVVADIRGRERPDETVVIGGHLDSWDLGTGAIDDGAGVAITTAAAKLIRDLPQRPRRTIRLVLWGAEEIGGAAPAFARTHGPEEQAKMVIASECDFGAERVIKVRLPHGALASPYGQALGRTLVPLKVVMERGPAQDGGADLEGLKGVPLAELAQDGTHYFDLHHTADDTLDKTDPREMDKAVATWAAFTWLAADTDVDFRALAARTPQPEPSN